MQFHTQTLSLAGAPALAVHVGSREEALRKGAVLLFHGLGASKEVHTAELSAFASRGLYAVGVDAVGHGARRYPDFDTRFSFEDPRRRHEEFLTVVRESARHDADARLGGSHPRRGGVDGPLRGRGAVSHFTFSSCSPPG
ncbi:hypothetical protein JY651_14245 [Pyxidicoccus parkwayensis]|uniref:Serine aminopeptidase S33 domain-containing protein n=1 Tax=Pyxidicoccus parkwayensis TaxID=2813578 RepID=A0ABX7P6F3_9BACT|nr:hypothetical protein [Pyxidicoccus parkwaysis]QSQ26010.1 hypothetical protein JY651_14245 [Pyxidicoccus parkwaysis]